jgi:hypothetical protein
MRKKTIITAAASALVLAGTGTALASIPDSNGVFHACYTPTSNGSPATVKVINTALSGGHCLSGQKGMRWSQTGPQGPQGPAGPSTAGPAGLDVQVVYDPAGGSNGSTAWCPSDHPYVVGGGYRIVGGTTEAKPGTWYSIPSEPSAQQATGAYSVYTGSGGASQIYAIAICAK